MANSFEPPTCEIFADKALKVPDVQDALDFAVDHECGIFVSNGGNDDATTALSWVPAT